MRVKKVSARLISNTAIVMIVIWVVVGVLAAGGIVWWRKVYSDTHKDLYRKIDEDGFFAEWQKYLSDDANIVSVAMPGSHDAATKGMMPLAETQRHSIYEQLCAGSRYLDLRVTKKRENKKDKLVMFHSVVKGCSLDSVLKDITRFVERHPTEFLILDFQHIGMKCDKEVVAAVKKGLDMNKAINKDIKEHFLRSKESGKQVTMKTIRGGNMEKNKYNYVIIWGGDTAATNNDAHFYTRELTLFSPYDAKYHRKKDGGELLKHFDTYYKSYSGNGFFVLQSVRTASNILMHRPMDNELEFKKKINPYINGIRRSKDSKDMRLALTNIVIRDYVASDEENVKAILRLNVEKRLENNETEDLIINTMEDDYKRNVGL